jgi:adenylate cyclase
MSILIVDDSAGSRLLLSSILKAAGYQALVTAESARGAFARLGLNGTATGPSDVDLILMDISMPDLDGIEACCQIKADVRLQDIPIIMVTASTVTEDLQLAFAAGAMDYITKPPNKVELLARVRSALELKQEMDRRKEVTLQLQETNRRLEEALASLDEEHRQLLEEQAKSERLLLNILPRPIAERLKQAEGVIADNFSDVTVLFADIVDFTKLSARVPAADVVAMLNDVFSKFDRLAEKHGLEKIKTIGDAYMVVGGLPTPRPDHAEAVADMALDMRAALAGRTRDTGSLLSVRIGINSGPVVAGVIGTKKFIYDLWGDTVNIASRMESLGASGSIQVTAATYEHLRDRYIFERRGTVQVKGRGEMVTYQLAGRK